MNTAPVCAVKYFLFISHYAWNPFPLSCLYRHKECISGSVETFKHFVRTVQLDLGVKVNYGLC